MRKPIVGKYLNNFNFKVFVTYARRAICFSILPKTDLKSIGRRDLVCASVS